MLYQKTVKPRTIFCRDNLEIMRGMDDESIDLIYLDPPFNKGKNFHAPIGTNAQGASFKDIWDEADTKEEWHGLIAENHPKLYEYLAGVESVGSRSAKYYLIYMAVRLIEMHRILKPTGSLYLHCDPTASHYLKLLMDAVFGNQNFQNEIIWRRSSAHNDAKKWGGVHDVILFYTKTDKFFWSGEAREDYDPDYIEQFYRQNDEKGRYSADNLTGPGLSGGDSGKPWKGADPSDRGRCWSVPKADKLPDWVDVPDDYDTFSPQKRLDILDAQGLIQHPKKSDGMPRFKRYLDLSKGVTVQDIITDIKWIGAHAKERQGYPTQKPLALLERIIKASCPEFGVILDPFCGCATTCVAAERQQRMWMGIDISAKAYELVQHRMAEEVPKDLLTALFEIHFRMDIPQRTDHGEFIMPARERKHTLYGMQEGRCAGCSHLFEFRHFEVDHIVPRKKGGGDDEDNLQLLCGSCNRIKGVKDMTYLKKRLKEIIPAPLGEG